MIASHFKQVWIRCNKKSKAVVSATSLKEQERFFLKTYLLKCFLYVIFGQIFYKNQDRINYDYDLIPVVTLTRPAHVPTWKKRYWSRRIYVIQGEEFKI